MSNEKLGAEQGRGMKFRIHFLHADCETEDYFDVRGETVEEIRAKASDELFMRGGIGAWSEELSQ